MKSFTFHNVDAAQFVAEAEKRLNVVFLSTTTTPPVISEGSCVITVIGMLSEGTVETLGQIYFEQLMNT